MFRFHSLRTKILLLLLALQLPLLLIFVAMLQYTVQDNNHRILATISNTTASQTAIMNNVMIESSATIQLFNSKTPFVPQEKDASQWYFYYKDLQNTINILEAGTYQSHPMLMYYFVYNASSDYFLKSSVHQIDIYDQIELRQQLKESNLFHDSHWQTISLHDAVYFLYSVHQGDYVLGVLMNCNEILDTFYASSDQKTEYLLINRNNECISYRDSGTHMQSLLEENGIPETTDTSWSMDGYTMQLYKASYGFSVLSATRLPSFLETLLGNPFFLLIILYFIVTIPTLIFILWKTLLTPVNYILFGFRQIENGDLSYRAQENMFSSEFRTLNRSFNAMVRQIKELRMDYYEEKIRQQKAENRYLRTISYPHFLLNNLNLINNFAYQKNEEGIHEAVLNLSTYLRYFVTSSSDKHTLAHDIQSARCYLNLNQLAYPDRIVYTLDYEDALLDFRFPPLIVSTIIENCIKHGLMPDKILEINLTLHIEEWDNSPALVLIICNGGPSFPKDLLEQINNNQYQDQITNHVGLISIKQTLFHIFGDNANFHIESSNDCVHTCIRVKMEALLRYQGGENS